MIIRREIAGAISSLSFSRRNNEIPKGLDKSLHHI